MSTALHTGDALAWREAGATAGPRRLLVLAHGVGGNERNLLALAAAAPPDTLVVLPRAPLALGPDQFAWFPVTFGTDGPRPDLAAADASRERLAAFIAGRQSATGIDAAHTIVAGFSQGGILSASVALTRPDLVAGFAVLAGRILPELEPRLAPAPALANLRAFIGHGRDDAKLPVEWAHRADAWLARLGVARETRLYPGGHGIGPDMQRDFQAWLDRRH